MAVEYPINAPLRTLVDGNMDVFRYGLFKYDDSNFEDPTYLGFTVEIDENSALFTQVMPFLEKQGATRAELNARIPVYKEFVSKIVSIFKSQESIREPSDKGIYIKQHYINSISGLDNLSKKFNKWRTDKLSFELYEDIGLYTSYIAYLYNNLTYSFENGRALIPENLLKFNLYIKFSEIRNLTSIAKIKSNDPIDKRIVDGLKNNITCLVYKLYDCEFDFFGSKPFEDSVAQAGIDTSVPGHSIVNMDVYFKSVSRQIFNPLVNNALAMNDNKIDLDVIIVGTNGNRNTNGQVTDASGAAVGPDGQPYQQLSVDAASTYNQEAFHAQSNRKPSDASTYNIETTINPELKENSDLAEQASQKGDILDYNAQLAPDMAELRNSEFSPLKANDDATLLDKLVGKDLTNVVQDPQAALNNLTNKIKSRVENTAKDQLNKAVTLLKQKRNALVKNFIYDLQNRVGLKTIIPDNVYTDQDYYKNALDRLKSDVGLTIADEIIKTITGN